MFLLTENVTTELSNDVQSIVDSMTSQHNETFVNFKEILIIAIPVVIAIIGLILTITISVNLFKKIVGYERDIDYIANERDEFYQFKEDYDDWISDRP